MCALGITAGGYYGVRYVASLLLDRLKFFLPTLVPLKIFQVGEAQIVLLTFEHQHHADIREADGCDYLF
tara:strand:+ start:3617 stop:3823 length:207 start_codon:yes stop_codon:yes gene_type:complete